MSVPRTRARVVRFGVASPLGLGREEHWEGLANGRSALAGSPPAGRIDRERARAELASRDPELARHATTFEATLLGLALTEIAAPRGAVVVVGTTKGILEPFLREAGFVPLAVSQACASGTLALALGARLVAEGEVTRLIAAGAEALSPFVEEGFRSLEALDLRGARPFDRSRAGLSLGEGAAAFLLEREGPGPNLVGAGSASDAFSSTSPDPEGRGLERAIRAALAGASEPPAFVCAHGTGTEKNDAAELAALRRACPGSCIFSIKGRTGHALGAAGALDVASLLLALERGIVPGTARDPIDPAVTAAPVALRARVALSANAGFGGLDTALAFEVVP
jgi:3-oxoacyl-(acyl-carrier-protein) synthase